jgi:hypothetical protein
MKIALIKDQRTALASSTIEFVAKTAVAVLITVAVIVILSLVSLALTPSDVILQMDLFPTP